MRNTFSRERRCKRLVYEVGGIGQLLLWMSGILPPRPLLRRRCIRRSGPALEPRRIFHLQSQPSQSQPLSSPSRPQAPKSPAPPPPKRNPESGRSLARGRDAAVSGLAAGRAVLGVVCETAETEASPKVWRTRRASTSMSR